MPDLGPLAGAVVSLVSVAARNFLNTVLVVVLLGCGLAVAGGLIAAPGGALHATVAVVVALAVTATLGTTLAIKRAVGAALLDGARRHGVGRAAVDLVFDRAGLDAAAGKVPLADAERRLGDAVRGLTARTTGGGLGGWLRRKLEARLLSLVEIITLARFRAAGENLDGPTLRAELGSRADALIEAKIRAALLGATVVLTLAIAGLSIAAALALR